MIEFKKCVRCGSFFTSNSDTCPRCDVKDINEMSQLKSYLEATGYAPTNHYELSKNTGISINNLNRFLDKDKTLNIEL